MRSLQDNSFPDLPPDTFQCICRVLSNIHPDSQHDTHKNLLDAFFDKDDLDLKSAASYRMYQEESAIIWENMTLVNLHQYNKTYLYPELNDYGDNGKINFQEWELLYIYFIFMVPCIMDLINIHSFITKYVLEQEKISPENLIQFHNNYA